MKKIHNNIFKAKKLIIFLFYLQLCYFGIKSNKCDNCKYNKNDNICEPKDSSSYTDCTDCKPSLTNKEKCFDCSGIQSNNYIISNGECQAVSQGCDYKIVNETKECVGHCSDETYEIGDYCVYKCDDSNKLANEDLKICECTGKYIVYQQDEPKKRKRIECLSPTDKCEYYDSDTHECVQNCGNKKIRIFPDNSEYKYRCSNQCERGEFTYKKIENSKEVIYCAIKCEEGQFYYHSLLEGINYCKDSCDNEGIFLYSHGECKSECEGGEDEELKIIIDLSAEKGKFKCSNENTEGYYIYKEQYYLKSCNYTKEIELFNKITTYENNGECVETCEEYFSEDTYECTDCVGKFFIDKKCLSLETCKKNGYNYYIIEEEINSATYISSDHSAYECVKQCPPGYYTDINNKICFKNCPRNSYISNNFECSDDCKPPTDPSLFKPGEGYKIIEVTEGGDRKQYCYSSCSLSNGYFYHLSGEYECTIKDCESQNKYSAYDNPYICYDSCKDIGNQYIYENDYICYKTSVMCNEYYYIKEGITFYASLEECKNKFKYIKGKECKSQCDPNDYKIEYIAKNDGTIQNLGICFIDPEDCINESNEKYLFYNQTDKICRKECDVYKTSNENPLMNEKGETCFSSCPSNFPYKDTNNKLCLAKCPNYFYGYECLDNCKSRNKYYFENSKECLDSCKIDNKYYYIKEDDTDNICYYSCPPGYFVEKALSNQKEPYKCILNCVGNSLFYYEDKKICREACDILYKSENEKICVYQCSEGQKVYNNKYCRDTCLDGQFISREKLSNINSLIVDKCVTNCPNDSPLKSHDNKLCLKQCNLEESYKYNDECYKQCPEKTFVDEYKKECFDKNCPSEYKYYEYDDTKKINICKNFCGSDKFYLSKGGECLSKCPKDFPYIGINNVCLDNCTGIHGEYFEIYPNSDSESNTYLCLKSCEEKTIFETRECVSECPPPLYTSPNNYCYKICNLDENYPFSSKDYKCAKKCDSELENFGKDKVCRNGCSDLRENIIDYDNQCVSDCKNLYYKYQEDGKCVNKCSPGKYSTKDNKCVDNCEYPNNYIENNECRSQCDSNHFAKEIINNRENTNIFECVEKCDQDQFYYETGSIFKKNKCLPECDEGDFVIQYKQICIGICPSAYYSYFYDKSDSAIYKQNTCVKKCPSDKPYVHQGRCVSGCSYYTNKYHNEGDFNCIYQCPSGSKIYDYTCMKQCPEQDAPFYLENSNKCIGECPPKFPLYVEGINKCLSNCEQGYKKEGNKCVISCSNDNPYINDKNECVNKCESSNNHAIKIFTHGEENTDNKCSDKCKDPYTFEEPSENNMILCVDECHFIQFDNNICRKKCDEEYKFYDYEEGKCYNICPSQKQFYIPIENGESQENILCHKKCPNGKPYFKSNNDGNAFECFDNCDGFVNFTTNECLEDCENKKKFEYSEEITYCLNDCEELGLFQYGEQCIKDCSSINSNLISNVATKTCQCKNLYYIKENKEIQCIDGDDCSSAPSGYNYKLFNSNQCLEKCNGENYVLSFDEKYCYESEKFCPKNTKSFELPVKTKANNKCDCAYKYYMDESEKKICLGENEECPSNYKLHINSNICYKECPDGSKLFGNNICLDCNEENQYWQINNNNEPECIPECSNWLISETNQCVENCEFPNNIYLNINNLPKKCVSSCTSIENTISKKLENPDNSYYKCFCTDLWYKDEGKDENDKDVTIYCNQDVGKTTCEGFSSNKKYLVKDTRECVRACPNEYPFLFGNECFNNCEDVKRYYDYDVKQIDEKNCDCKNLYKDIDGKKICINSDTCYEDDNYNLLISNTNQCVTECNEVNNIIFNNTCYNNCPKNTISDNNGSCKCKNKGYKYNYKSFEIYICFENENENCPVDFYPYFDSRKNLCVEKCEDIEGEDLFIFNYTCYQECPENSEEEIKEDSKSCKCKKESGVWYRYKSEGKTFYKCGLNECPEGKKYIDNDTNECKFSCVGENKFVYQGKCYKECPDNLSTVSVISNECVEIFSFEEDPKDLDSLDEIVKEDNIQQIYKRTTEGGFLYNLNNSTMQIYGVNKNGKENKDLIMRNNLTYIDLSNCIDNIYKKKELSEETDLIIVKYDIWDTTDSSTINPVEYKIFESSGGQSIDLNEYCKDNSIIISYPLSNILNNLDADLTKLRNLESNDLNVKERFLKGKEIYLKDNDIDSFNPNNKLYTDICYPFTIAGKDLTLEDRFNYLYSFYSFCESNCVYGRTDFINERIYCNCSPKREVDFNRPYQLMETVENSQKAKDKQKGSILKCIGKISEISKNFGFYYGFIALLIEIGMCILTFLYSYKVFIMRMKTDLNLKDDNNLDTGNNEELSEDKKSNKKTNEDIIKTSERNLVNPPKKENNSKTNNEKKNKDIDKDTKKKNTSKKEEKIKDAEVINIKKNKQNWKKVEGNIEGKISSSDNQNLYDEKIEKNSLDTVKEMDDDDNIFELIKSEHKLITVDYNCALKKNHAELIIMIIAEILDKIYIIKAILFLTKYEIFSAYFSLYALWHMLIISFLSLFYNNSTLHKIWTKNDYPNLSFHLSFGFVSCLISFIFYKGLFFLINNDRKIKEIDEIPKDNRSEISEKFKKLLFWSKIKIIIFYAIEFILTFIFYLYLIAFCGTYIGTRDDLAESYGITLVEVVIIKILYGLVLAILRKISLVYEISKLYSIVRFLDLYIA